MTYRALRLLADENISPPVIAFLWQWGLDVLDVKEGWQGEDDDVLLERAFKDQRFVLTYDADFGDLAINLGRAYYGIIYLRLRNLSPDHVNAVMAKFLASSQPIVPGMLIVVQDTRVRIRRPNTNSSEP